MPAASEADSAPCCSCAHHLLQGLSDPMCLQEAASGKPHFQINADFNAALATKRRELEGLVKV